MKEPLRGSEPTESDADRKRRLAKLRQRRHRERRRSAAAQAPPAAQAAPSPHTAAHASSAPRRWTSQLASLSHPPAAEPARYDTRASHPQPLSYSRAQPPLTGSPKRPARKPQEAGRLPFAADPLAAHTAQAQAHYAAARLSEQAHLQQQQHQHQQQPPAATAFGLFASQQLPHPPPPMRAREAARPPSGLYDQFPSARRSLQEEELHAVAHLGGGGRKEHGGYPARTFDTGPQLGFLDGVPALQRPERHALQDGGVPAQPPPVPQQTQEPLRKRGMLRHPTPHQPPQPPPQPSLEFPLSGYLPPGESRRSAQLPPQTQSLYVPHASMPAQHIHPSHRKPDGHAAVSGLASLPGRLNGIHAAGSADRGLSAASGARAPAGYPSGGGLSFQANETPAQQPVSVQAPPATDRSRTSALTMLEAHTPPPPENETGEERKRRLARDRQRRRRKRIKLESESPTAPKRGGDDASPGASPSGYALSASLSGGVAAAASSSVRGGLHPADLRFADPLGHDGGPALGHHPMAGAISKGAAPSRVDDPLGHGHHGMAAAPKPAGQARPASTTLGLSALSAYGSAGGGASASPARGGGGSSKVEPDAAPANEAPEERKRRLARERQRRRRVKVRKQKEEGDASGGGRKGSPGDTARASSALAHLASDSRYARDGVAGPGYAAGGGPAGGRRGGGQLMHWSEVFQSADDAGIAVENAVAAFRYQLDAGNANERSFILQHGIVKLALKEGLPKEKLQAILLGAVNSESN